MKVEQKTKIFTIISVTSNIICNSCHQFSVLLSSLLSLNENEKILHAKQYKKGNNDDIVMIRVGVYN